MSHALSPKSLYPGNCENFWLQCRNMQISVCHKNYITNDIMKINENLALDENACRVLEQCLVYKVQEGPAVQYITQIHPATAGMLNACGWTCGPICCITILYLQYINFFCYLFVHVLSSRTRDRAIFFCTYAHIDLFIIYVFVIYILSGMHHFIYSCVTHLFICLIACLLYYL